MTELLTLLGLYLLGSALIAAGTFVLFGAGITLIVVGCFSLLAAFLLSRGIARVAVR